MVKSNNVSSDAISVNSGKYSNSVVNIHRLSNAYDCQTLRFSPYKGHIYSPLSECKFWWVWKEHVTGNLWIIIFCLWAIVLVLWKLKRLTILILCTRLFVYIIILFECVCACVCECVCVWACLSVCVCVCVLLCMFECVFCVCAYLSMCVCVHVWLCMCSVGVNKCLYSWVAT